MFERESRLFSLLSTIGVASADDDAPEISVGSGGGPGPNAPPADANVIELPEGVSAGGDGGVTQDEMANAEPNEQDGNAEPAPPANDDPAGADPSAEAPPAPPAPPKKDPVVQLLEEIRADRKQLREFREQDARVRQETIERTRAEAQRKRDAEERAAVARQQREAMERQRNDERPKPPGPNASTDELVAYNDAMDRYRQKWAAFDTEQAVRSAVAPLMDSVRDLQQRMQSQIAEREAEIATATVTSSYQSLVADKRTAWVDQDNVRDLFFSFWENAQAREEQMAQQQRRQPRTLLASQVFPAFNNAVARLRGQTANSQQRVNKQAAADAARTNQQQQPRPQQPGRTQGPGASKRPAPSIYDDPALSSGS